MLVKTKHGMVEGIRDGKYRKFLGIPYAVAGRFEAPREYDWEGVLHAGAFGKRSIQSWKQAPGQSREEFSEDCLNLNIWLPAETSGADGGKLSGGTGGLPVAVYIHGGAFQNGSNQDRSGERVIGDHHFIYISINYRLGVAGYLYLGKALGEKYAHTGNNGTMDQLAALKWIYENIEAFGGDPSRITVFGESAGAKTQGAMLFRPEMKKWCSGVMMASGAWQCIRTEETAATVADAFFEEMFRRNPRSRKEDILTMDVDRLLEIQERIVDNPGNTCMFGPVADGVTVPYDWKERLERGEYWSGNAVVGSCLHEMTFLRNTPGFPSTAPKIAEALFGENARIALEEFADYEKETEAQGRKPSETEAADEWIRILSDYMYRTYSHRLAGLLTRTGSRVWYYSFEYGRASHVQDQSMAFDGAAGEDALFENEPMEEREEMAELLHESYVRFLETGNPSWEGIPEWHPLCERPEVMVWNRKPRVRSFTEGEVLHRFPQEVYRRFRKNFQSEKTF